MTPDSTLSSIPLPVVVRFARRCAEIAERAAGADPDAQHHAARARESARMSGWHAYTLEHTAYARRRRVSCLSAAHESMMHAGYSTVAACGLRIGYVDRMKSLVRDEIEEEYRALADALVPLCNYPDIESLIS